MKNREESENYRHKNILKEKRNCDKKSMTKDIPLYNLAKEYLKQYGEISEDLKLIQGPTKHAVKFLILVEGAIIGVWILDWNRSVGVDKIIHIERILQRSNLTAGFVVANNFSPNAREIAKQTNDQVILIEKAEILYHT